MRNKAFLAVVGLAMAIVIIGAGCAKNVKPGTAAPAEETKVQTEDFNGSLADLFKRGKPVKCTFSVTVQNVSQTGEVYVASGKARTDISMDAAGIKKTIHAIALGDAQYVWEEAAKTGMKIVMSIDEQQRLAAEAKPYQTAEQNKQSVDWGVKTNYKCVGWTVDDSLFTVPANVTFTDFTEMLKNLPKAPTVPTANLKTNVCAVCDSLPAQVRDACRKQNCK